MELRFEIDGEPAEFVRSATTGRAEVRLGDEVRVLQSPWRLSAQFGLSTRTVWIELLRGHTIEVRKTRPRMFGGLRRNSFVVTVDGQEVAEATGR